jgi:uncharacterized cupredoxin-like copper-binding protein
VASDATYELIKFTLGPGGGIVPSPTAPMNQAPVSDATAAAAATATTNVAPVTPEADKKGVLRILVEAGDLYFKPNALAIPANNDVKVTVRNVGALQHDFVIEDPSIDSGMIASGNSVELTLNLAPGTYQFLCTVEGHADAGMIGTITAE